MAPRTRWLLLSVLAGLLVLAFGAPLVEPLFAQTGLDIDLNVDTTTVRPRTGVVTVSGMVTCSQAVNTLVFVGLTQPVGRTRSVIGYATIPIACAGPDVRRFDVRIVGSVGRFDLGIAYLNATVQGCILPEPYPGPGPQCDSDQVSKTVRLRRP